MGFSSAMVKNPLVIAYESHRADLGAKAALRFGLIILLLRHLRLLLKLAVQLGLQLGECDFLVGRLRPLRACLDPDVRGEVRQTHPSAYLVLVLATLPSRSEHVRFDIGPLQRVVAGLTLSAGVIHANVFSTKTTMNLTFMPHQTVVPHLVMYGLGTTLRTDYTPPENCPYGIDSNPIVENRRQVDRLGHEYLAG